VSDHRTKRKAVTENIRKAMQHLNRGKGDLAKRTPIPFTGFLKELYRNPSYMMRNVFQVFHDMVQTYVGEGIDEYPDDPESIQFVAYDCTRLFIEGSDHPFFADRLFANRLMNLVEALRLGAQQNKIYIFDGPPGCGKSTFLNNLLRKFEEYANTEEGSLYETVWRLDRRLLGGHVDRESDQVLERLSRMISESDLDMDDSSANQEEDESPKIRDFIDDHSIPRLDGEYVEVPCPSHDNPILMIPKDQRRAFFDDLFETNEFKWNLSFAKEYDWVFRDNPCTICSSLFQALFEKLQDPQAVFQMIYARPYQFNRRLGEGVSVFNPGDRPMRRNILSNPILQRRIDSLLRDSNQVKYIFSRYAKTNNGIYALMDIKQHNKDRLIQLHNIISEGIHKVEDIEENVSSLFLAVMNPEDQKNVQSFQSFSDRIEYIHIPYVLDLKTEVEIYRNIFGKHIEEAFLPRVMHNFARVIISTRLSAESDAMSLWIKNPEKYELYCDKNLQLLKMEMFSGHIPNWLSEEDRKSMTAKVRRQIIAEAESEGQEGFSGRDSIKIFNDFFSFYTKEDKLINMEMLIKYFTKTKAELGEEIPEGFLDSLQSMYNYTVLQEVKESLYYYNEEQIARDIQNYIFAVNFELGSVETCTYTGEKLEITEEFYTGIESRLFDSNQDENSRHQFRKDTQREYASKTLTQEIMNEGKKLTETELFESLHERYVYNLKEKVLDPFLENVNFRRAIKDYDSDDFKTYDKRIRNDVSFLINNLCDKYGYSEQGAKEVCIYVIDNDLAKDFADG